MSQELGDSTEDERTILPIEKGFPIERVNEIAEKEARAKQWYRPIYTMHKWWARRLGCVFRAVCLYTLLDDPQSISVLEPGNNTTLGDFDAGGGEIEELLESVDIKNPDSLWELFPKDVRVRDKKVLDPFMGGGTSVAEASRFGASVEGNDLNPVAWFVSKKITDASEVSVDELESAYDRLSNRVESNIRKYYKTACPNGNHEADALYYFWVKELDCVSCNTKVPLFKDYRIGKGRYENDDSYHVLCPSCEEIILVNDWKSETHCKHCQNTFNPQNGNAGRGNYTCPECGQKYGVVDAIQEQDGFDVRLHAIEYYCKQCDEKDIEKSKVKSYKKADDNDIQLYKNAANKFSESETLREYIPDEKIPVGIKTDSSAFEGSIGGGFNVIRHGYEDWEDMFNSRQLFALSTLLEAIDKEEDQLIKEYLLMAFSGSLRYNCMMVSYNTAYNKIGDLFRSNSFNPPLYPIENNVWGAEYGSGTFSAMWDMVKRGVEYGNAPTERYIEDGETLETDNFLKPIGEDTTVEMGDARDINENNEYDAVITDPPYYDNVIYSELSNYFYVWLKIVLADEYEGFEQEQTPMNQSLVANPAVGKGAAEFEDEMRESFAVIHNSLTDDGVLVFTYHHSNSESWGELLGSLCDVGFEVTATYPITADINKPPAKLGEGESVSFDIIVVARPTVETTPISWNSLRREIYRTAQKTRQRLEENRDLSRGDIGVVEMGRCFHEYSKHHGKVKRAGETMTAKEVVDEIYGVIQHGSDIGEIDVFLDLLETPDPSFDDLNKLCRGTDATPEAMEDMRLYRMDDGFTLGTYDDEKRVAYIRDRVDSDEELTDLDKAQFLRYRWEHGKSVSEYLDEWGVDDDLRELCEGLADATGDDTYRNILETRLDDF